MYNLLTWISWFVIYQKVRYLTDLVNELNAELEARSKLIRQLSTQIKVRLSSHF